ncbi:MAG: phospho-N-acetylmuramoyl-pentapeptide-transferase [Chlamydiae bacterium]|nr:phospho-N-acetylmuramoyl-pentapeptide-transferase [Chlamydiota bacterium]
MLLLLIEFLSNFFGLKIPAVFGYSSTRMILAALTSLILTIFLGPFFIKKLYELKIGQSIRGQDICPLLAQLHEKKKDTPTMGGILILFSMLVSLFLWMDLTCSFTLILFIATVWLGFVGGIDDYLKLKYRNSKGLKSRIKFLLQLAFAFLLSLYLIWPALTNAISFKGVFEPPFAKEHIIKKEEHKNVIVRSQTLTTSEYIAKTYLPFFKDPVFVFEGFWSILSMFLIIFVIVGSSNAVNLTDGLDGLAAGCLVMTSIVLALFAFLSSHIDMSRYLNILYIDKSSEIAIYLFALAGASLGFLWYNGYPAQVFMGDIGSLALGGIIGVAAVLLRREFLLTIAGGIFVAEALSVILQVASYRYRNKKRIFLCAPLHHHFEYKGWPETKVVIRFWIIALLLAIIGIATIKFQ